MSTRFRSDEQGFAGGAEALVFGLLIFVVGTLIVANAWGVVDTKLAVDAAARQAARTYVEAADAPTALDTARHAAADALSGYGRDPAAARVTVSGLPWGRCTRVVITVSYPAPLVRLPFVGWVGTGEDVRAAHSELVDPYRSGLPGPATCA